MIPIEWTFCISLVSLFAFAVQRPQGDVTNAPEPVQQSQLGGVDKPSEDIAVGVHFSSAYVIANNCPLGQERDHHGQCRDIWYPDSDEDTTYRNIVCKRCVSGAYVRPNINKTCLPPMQVDFRGHCRKPWVEGE